MNRIFNFKFAALLAAALLFTGFTSCELFGLKGDEGTQTRDLGGVSYIRSTNIAEVVGLINKGQEGNNGEKYGDIGTVVEWDVDFTYLLTAGGSEYDVDPEILQNIGDYFNLGCGTLDAWYVVELWGADGGNVNTLAPGNKPGAFDEETYQGNWDNDHFTAGASENGNFFENSYAYGGKGGYIAAYVKVTAGQVLYFFVGGKGKDGTVIMGNGIGEDVIYGFNGGGKGAAGMSNNYLNGGGGGGATSLAYSMARFEQAVSEEQPVEVDPDTQEPIPVDPSTVIPAGTKAWMDDNNTVHYENLTIAAAAEKGWTPIFKYDFTQGRKPEAATITAFTDGEHYTSRILVAGGGGGAGQAHNEPWYTLHGGNGNGGFGQMKRGSGMPAGWGNANEKQKQATKQADESNVMIGAPTLTSVTNYASATAKGSAEGFLTADYRMTVANANATYGLILPPYGIGKGVNAGSSIKGGWNEGRGGGGGGFTGGGAVYNHLNGGGTPIKTGSSVLEPAGNLSNHAFPTAAGMGGTNGFWGMTAAADTIHGAAPTTTNPPKTVAFKRYDSAVEKSSANLNGIEHDSDTGLIKNAATIDSVVQFKIIKGNVAAIGTGNTGTDGISGVKTKTQLNEPRFNGHDFKGNGFVSVKLAKRAEAEGYTY